MHQTDPIRPHGIKRVNRFGLMWRLKVLMRALVLVPAYMITEIITVKWLVVKLSTHITSGFGLISVVLPGTGTQVVIPNKPVVIGRKTIDREGAGR